MPASGQPSISDPQEMSLPGNPAIIFAGPGK